MFAWIFKRYRNGVNNNVSLCDGRFDIIIHDIWILCNLRKGSLVRQLYLQLGAHFSHCIAVNSVIDSPHQYQDPQAGAQSA